MGMKMKKIFATFFSLDFSVKSLTCKAEKHEKIKTIASTKLNTIASHISKALSDNKVADEEFQLFLEATDLGKVQSNEGSSQVKD